MIVYLFVVIQIYSSSAVFFYLIVKLSLEKSDEPYLLFASRLPIDFFYIERFEVPFLGYYLVKKVNDMRHLPPTALYLNE